MEVRNLTKKFQGIDGPVTALKNINLKVHKREFVCVIGPSGCGKSTLIRTLAGLEEATSGEILLDDKVVTKPGPERGMVYQEYTLFPWLTVKKNIMFGLLESGATRSNAESEARQWKIYEKSKNADNYYCCVHVIEILITGLLCYKPRNTRASSDKFGNNKVSPGPPQKDSCVSV